MAGLNGRWALSKSWSSPSSGSRPYARAPWQRRVAVLCHLHGAFQRLWHLMLTSFCPQSPLSLLHHQLCLSMAVVCTELTMGVCPSSPSCSSGYKKPSGSSLAFFRHLLKFHLASLCLGELNSQQPPNPPLPAKSKLYHHSVPVILHSIFLLLLVPLTI